MNAGGVDKACKSSDLSVAIPIGSGERVSNTLIRTSKMSTARRKAGVFSRLSQDESRKTLRDRSRSDQLVGRVTAYQGYDR